MKHLFPPHAPGLVRGTWFATLPGLDPGCLTFIDETLIDETFINETGVSTKRPSLAYGKQVLVPPLKPGSIVIRGVLADTGWDRLESTVSGSFSKGLPLAEKPLEQCSKSRKPFARHEPSCPWCFIGKRRFDVTLAEGSEVTVMARRRAF